jgi:hypothetical protein
MEKQGSSLAKSCFFQIRNIERIRPYISNDASITLVSALVTSRFDSGNALSFGVNASHVNSCDRCLGANIMGSVLSWFNFNRLSFIHLLISAKQDSNFCAMSFQIGLTLGMPCRLV